MKAIAIIGCIFLSGCAIGESLLISTAIDTASYAVTGNTIMGHIMEHDNLGTFWPKDNCDDQQCDP